MMQPKTLDSAVITLVTCPLMRHIQCPSPDNSAQHLSRSPCLFLGVFPPEAMLISAPIVEPRRMTMHPNILYTVSSSTWCSLFVHMHNRDGLSNGRALRPQMDSFDYIAWAALGMGVFDVQNWKQERKQPRTPDLLCSVGSVWISGWLLKCPCPLRRPSMKFMRYIS